MPPVESVPYQFVTSVDREFTMLRDSILRLKLRKDTLVEDRERLDDEIEGLRVRLDAVQKARVVIQDVAKEVQSRLEVRLGGIVSLAMAAIFEQPYRLLVEFVERRNRTECDLSFEKDGEACDPMFASGGGAVDIASFALRCAFWSLKRTRNVIVLDEPFKFLSRDLQIKAAEMVRFVMEKLKLQFIIFTHIPELMEVADRMFQVSLDGFVSDVRVVGQESTPVQEKRPVLRRRRSR